MRGVLLTTTAAGCVVFGAGAAHAQQAYSPVLAGPVVGGVPGIPVNLSGFMDIVPGPSMAISVADVTGFKTVGGDGSGGGAGLGGALFVGTGAIVDITSSRFTNNVAQGGNGGNGSIYGGALNGGGIPSGVLGATSHIPGIPGLPGATPYGQSDGYAFGDGNGNGLAGTSGNAGVTAGSGGLVTPFVQGGQGGAGGDAQNGWTTNPVRQQALTDAATALSIASQSVTEAGVQQTIDTILNGVAITRQTADIALEAGAIAAEAEVTDAAISTVDAARAAVAIATDAIELSASVTQMSNDAAVLSTAGQSVTLATQQLTEATQSLASWYTGVAAGIYGGGGTGGKGGQGGQGGFGAAGGPGGNGGNGGIGFGLQNGGDGGAGGNGGISGFGAGGSQGGNGGQAALLGVNGGTTGAAGAGGIAGFGGGAGSSGTGVGVASPIGGGGGSGLGGAIFVANGGTVLINGISLFMGNSTIAGQSLNGGASGQAAGNSIFLQGNSQLIFGALPTDVTTFIGPQSIADDSAIGVGGLGFGSITVASGKVVMAPGTTNQYAGSTTIGSVLNPLGIPGLLSAVLRANDGDGLPSASQLIFTNAGILETNRDFNRTVGTGSRDVTWQGSGGFAYWNGIVTGDGSVPSAVPGNLTVTLSGNDPLVWGQFGFVPVGSALVFGAKDATGSVTFTNDILTGLAGVLPLTTVNITVVANDAQPNALQPGKGIASNIDYLEYTGSIIGLGGVSFNDLFNTGTVYLLNQQYYVGPTFLNNGLLSLQGKGSIAPSMLLDITGKDAVFDITNANGPTSVGGLAGTGTIHMGATPFSVTAALGPVLSNFGGVLDGTATFTVAGGYQVLSGANTYTGVTTIQSGAGLGLADSGSILTSAGLVDNGLFDISATTAGASIQTLSGNGQVNLGSQTLTLVNAQDHFDGAIGGIGGLTIAGGSETLTGANTLTGLVNVQQGATLALAGNGSLANATTVQADGTFDISGTSAGASLVSLGGAGTVALGAQSITLTGAHDTFSGVIGGSGALTLASGVETFTGVNTYTGTTTIGATGVLGLSGAGAIAASSSVQVAGLFDISNTTAGASVTSLGGAGLVWLGDRTLTITSANDTFSGAIGGTGGLSLTGGSETLSGGNAYTGITTIGAGSSLYLTGEGTIAASQGVVDNGVFDISGTSGGAAITTLSGNGLVKLGGRTLYLTAANDTFAGVISDPPGAALMLLAGTETLAGVNTYTGMTAIAGGAKLVLSGAGAIAQSSNVLVYGTLDVSGTTAGTSLMSLGGNGAVQLGSTSINLTNAQDSFFGIIAGSGGIAVTGGTQAFAGNNSYTGQTAISAGAGLAIVSDGSILASAGLDNDGVFDISAANGAVGIKTLSGAGVVNTGANMLYLTAAGDTFAGSIGGNGGLAVLGGTETLTGASTYTGGTYVTGGARLVVNGDAALGDAAGSLTLNGGTLAISADTAMTRNVVLGNGNGLIDTQSHALALQGVVSGNGGLVADGGGLITMTGINSYAGGTTIINHTTVAVNGDAALGDAAGAVDIASGTLLLQGALQSSRTFVVGSTSVIDANGYVLDLSGPLFLEALGGVPLLDGSARISDGSWSLTPTMLTLDAGSTLHGVGTIAMPATVNGILRPGNSPGTLAFAQSLELGATATLALNVDGTGTGTGAGNYSRVLVHGVFTAGGTLAPQLRDISGSANNTFTPSLGQSFVIVASDGGVKGSFASLVEPTDGLARGSRFDVLYTDNAVTMYTVPVTYTDLTAFNVALTANQTSTGGSVDALRPAPGLRANAAVTAALAPIYALGAAAIAPQLNHLSATGYGDALSSALDASRRNGDLIEDQLNGRRDGMATAGTVVQRGRLTYWMSAQGGLDKAETPGMTGHRATFDSVLIGVDKQLYSDTLVGLAVNYSSDKVASDSLGSRIDASVVNLTGYTAWNDGSLWIDSRVGVALTHFRGRRDLAAIGDTANGSGSGFGANGSAVAGYRLAVGGLNFTPVAGAEINLVNRGAIAEWAGDHGRAVALNVRSDTLTSLSTKIGFRLETLLSTGANSTLALAARSEWDHELGDRNTVTHASFAEAGSAVMANSSVRRDRDTALLSGGMTLTLPHNLSLWARYAADLGQNTFSSTATAGLRWTW